MKEENLDKKWERIQNMTKDELMDLKNSWQEYKRLTKTGFIIAFAVGFFASYVLFASGLVFK